MSRHRHQLLFAAAVELEVGALRQRLSAPPVRGKGMVTSRVVVAGVGRAGDAAFARTLQQRPDAVINIGLAGGVSAGSCPGDVVIPLVWNHPDRPTEPAVHADATLSRALLRGLRRSGLAPTTGSAVTVDRALHGAARRDRLRTAGIDLVEMEGAVWARLAVDAGVPFAAVRVVSDRADLRLPEHRHRIIEPTGRIRWWRWSRALASSHARQGVLEELRRLRRARDDWVRACARLHDLGHALADAETTILAEALQDPCAGS